MWTTNFCKNFSKNILLYMSSRLPENSFSAYVCYAPDGLFWLNLYLAQPCDEGSAAEASINTQNKPKIKGCVSGGMIYQLF